MNLSDLAGILEAEHHREKRITIRNLIIGAILVVVVLAAILISGVYKKVFPGEINGYLKIVLCLVPFFMLSYPYRILRRSLKAQTKIDQLIQLLEEGKTVQNLYEATVYKTTIPLGRIKLQLNPFQYLYFNIESHSFELPIPGPYSADIKTLFSGVTTNQVADVWKELYTEDQNNKVREEEVPLKPLAAFRQFVTDNLKDKVEANEKSRKTTKKIMYLTIVCIMLLMGSFIYIGMRKTANDSKLLDSGSVAGIQAYQDAQQGHLYYYLIGFVVVLAFSYGFSLVVRKNRNTSEDIAGGDFMDFKVNMLKQVLHFINPSFVYAQHGHVSLAEVMDTHMFIDKAYKINGNDLIMGRHFGIPFQYSDLQLSYRPNFRNEKEGDDIAFSGQYFVTRFNKRFSEPLFIYPKKSVKGIFTNNDIHSYTNTFSNSVKLEDLAFNNLFDVYCNDQVMARYILTPTVMERIKTLAARSTKGKYFMAFHHNKVSVLNNSGTDAFETDLNTQLNTTLLDTYYQNICDQLAIIEELRLNVKIWSA